MQVTDKKQVDKISAKRHEGDKCREIVKEGPALVPGEGLCKHVTLTRVLKGEGKHHQTRGGCWSLRLERPWAVGLRKAAPHTGCRRPSVPPAHPVTCIVSSTFLSQPARPSPGFIYWVNFFCVQGHFVGPCAWEAFLNTTPTPPSPPPPPRLCTRQSSPLLCSERTCSKCSYHIVTTW